MKITKRQLRRIICEGLLQERSIIREVSASHAMLNKAREINRGKAAKLFQRFDDIEHRMSKMNYSHPEFESTNSEYDEIEAELEALGYEITGTINPFKVSGGKIQDKATGEIVHTRQGR